MKRKPKCSHPGARLIESKTGAFRAWYACTRCGDKINTKMHWHRCGKCGGEMAIGCGCPNPEAKDLCFTCGGVV